MDESSKQDRENLGEKCATMGCHGARFEGDFCVACLAQNPFKPLVQRRCDNLTCISDDSPRSS